MNDCRRIQRLLSRYLDNEIGDFDAALVEEHLKSCRRCKNDLAELSRIKNILTETERKILPPDYLVQRLWEITAGERKKRFSLAGIGKLSRRLIPVPLFGIVLSAILLFLVSVRPDPGGYLLEDSILSGTPVTTEAALGLILGVVD